VSAPALTTNLDLDDEKTRSDAAQDPTLKDELRVKVVEAVLDGSEELRERQTSHVKLFTYAIEDSAVRAAVNAQNHHEAVSQTVDLFLAPFARSKFPFAMHVNG
jgi:hypothetical protein